MEHQIATEHSNLLKYVLLELSKIPKTRVWQNDCGTARSFDGKRVIKYGLTGSSDIIGISNSRFIAVEIKIGKDKQREAQKNFQKMIESCGGIYVIVKEKEDLEKLKALI